MAAPEFSAAQKGSQPRFVSCPPSACTHHLLGSLTKPFAKCLKETTSIFHYFSMRRRKTYEKDFYYALGGGGVSVLFKTLLFKYK